MDKNPLEASEGIRKINDSNALPCLAPVKASVDRKELFFVMPHADETIAPCKPDDISHPATERYRHPYADAVKGGA